MSDNKFDLIEGYLENTLSESDRTAFEQALSNDTALQQEVTLQKDIINALKDIRKTELKSRLNNIPVSSGLSTFQKFGIAAVTLSGAALLTLGIFSANEETTASTTGTTEEVTTVSNEGVAEVESTIETTEELSSEEVTSTEVTENTSESTPEPKEANTTSEESVVEASQLEVPNPNAFGIDEGGTVSHEDNSNTNPTGAVIESSESNSAPSYKTTIKNSSKKFVYEYDGEQLTLTGDFDKTPYTIIENEESNATKLYLKFKQKFYAINVTKKPTKFIELEDQALINTLSKK